MGSKVIFSLRSQRDLQKIVEHIVRDDEQAAERFGMAIIQQAENLSKALEMGTILIARPGCRYFPFGNYLIIYRVDPSRKTVRVLRIWHGARRTRPRR
jgi:plasmid stabilization system protein ParE